MATGPSGFALKFTRNSRQMAAGSSRCLKTKIPSLDHPTNFLRRASHFSALRFFGAIFAICDAKIRVGFRPQTHAGAADCGHLFHGLRRALRPRGAGADLRSEE